MTESPMPTQQPGPFNLATTYLRLRPDTSIETLPVNDEFWPRLMSGALGTFHHEYLVTMHGFTADWPNWEQHPNGDEIVCLLEGRVTMVLEPGPRASSGAQRDRRLRARAPRHVAYGAHAHAVSDVVHHGGGRHKASAREQRVSS